MFSISLNSCEDNEHIKKMNKFVSELNDLFGYMTSEENASLADAEIRVSDTFRSLEQTLLEVCVSIKAGEKANEQVVCPACQESCRPLRIQEKHFTTLYGKISVNRWVYECEQGHRHAPWDAKQKLLDKYTHRVTEMMCRLAMQLDFREAVDELLRQGIEVSHTTLHQKVDEWSEDLRVPEQVEIQELSENERWYVSCDGCYTNSPAGWKETKVGCIYRDYPHYCVDASSSVRTSSIRYVAGQRCKQASMRWEKPGINAVLKFRCLSKNKVWDRYWYPNTKAA